MRWLLSLLALAAPAQAEWTAASPAVTEAAKDADVAAVLRESEAIDAAIVARDKAGFVGRFAADAVVNGPANTVNRRGDAERGFDAGMVNYEYLRRSIEYAARRGRDEVVLMGEETYKPRAGAMHAGKTVKRRFTDIWRRERAGWRLSLRQATVIGVPTRDARMADPERR